MSELETRLLAGERNFTEEELSDLVDSAKEYISGESFRWTQSVEAIIEVGSRYFSIDYDQALTENQESSFHNQPIEVQQVERTVVVIDYIPLNK